MLSSPLRLDNWSSFDICENVNNTRKHNVQKVYSLFLLSTQRAKCIKLIFTINITVPINAMYSNAHKPYTERGYTPNCVFLTNTLGKWAQFT